MIALIVLTGLLLLGLIGLFIWVVADYDYQMRMYYKELRETYPYKETTAVDPDIAREAVETLINKPLRDRLPVKETTDEP